MNWWFGSGAADETEFAEPPRLKFDPYDHHGFEEFTKPARIEIGIVPLYAKLRL